MKYNFKLIFGLLLLFVSCKKEYTEIQDMRINPEDITRIELRADSRQMLPNGRAKNEFSTLVYATKTILNYTKYTDENKNIFSKIDTLKNEYLVPNDQLPIDYVKVYDASGKVLENNIFSTSNTALAGTNMKFYAKGGSVVSNELSIYIRPLEEEIYDEIVVPVIFHVILPPPTSGITYDISSEYLQSVLDNMNNIFNGKTTLDPNGGNAKVTFKLALYNPTGGRLMEPGKNVIMLTDVNMALLGTKENLTIAYNSLIANNKGTFVWDVTKYLNIWLTRFRTNVSSSGAGYSYVAEYPKYFTSDYSTTSVPGLTGITTKDSYINSDIVDSGKATGGSLDAGILVNFKAFLVPQSQSVTNPFSFAVPLGLYYGLLPTASPKSSYPTTDPDYCDDTDIYYASSNPSVYKSNASYADRPENIPLNYFTSFNVMDVNTRGTSISVDQAKRIRSVMERAPNRWAYKSDFALTGR